MKRQRPTADRGHKSGPSPGPRESSPGECSPCGGRVFYKRERQRAVKAGAGGGVFSEGAAELRPTWLLLPEVDPMPPRTSSHTKLRCSLTFGGPSGQRFVRR